MTKTNQHLALKKCGRISAVVSKKAAAGVSIREIFSSIQSHQNAPGSMTTFYKLYRDDLDAARGDITEKIGNKVVQQAIDGDYKSQELWLTTKGGWSKNQTINVLDDAYTDEEKNSALDALLSKLGIEDKEEENGS